MAKSKNKVIRPIVLGSNEINAIEENGSGKIRRVIRPQPRARLAYCLGGYKCGKWSYPSDDVWKYWGEEFRQPDDLTKEERNHYWAPPYHTNDILWVKEAWAELETVFGVPYIAYKADDGKVHYSWGQNFTVWNSPVSMSPELARNFLCITYMGIERIQDITDEQAITEGFRGSFEGSGESMGCGWNITPREEYSKFWNRKIAKKDLPIYGWEANPWVWAFEIKKISKEEAYANNIA